MIYGQMNDPSVMENIESYNSANGRLWDYRVEIFLYHGCAC